MRFLVDMPLSVHIAQWLRQQGHDAVHLREEGLQRLPDDLIAKKAATEHRTILTMDIGFGHLLAFAGAREPSVILFRLHDERPHTVQALLAHHLPTLTSDLQAGAIVLIEEHGVRIHRLPIQLE